MEPVIVALKVLVPVIVSVPAKWTKVLSATVAAVPRPKLVLAVLADAKSERLFALRAADAKVAVALDAELAALVADVAAAVAELLALVADVEAEEAESAALVADVAASPALVVAIPA